MQSDFESKIEHECKQKIVFLSGWWKRHKKTFVMLRAGYNASSYAHRKNRLTVFKEKK